MELDASFSIYPILWEVWLSNKRIFMHYSLMMGSLQKYTEIWRHMLNTGEARHFLLLDVYAVVAYN